MANNASCRILSLDGGGLRGLITAIMLEKLETKLKERDRNKSLKDYFDIIAGTSTGSLIACGISKGMSATQIKELYLNQAIVIFPRVPDVISSLLSRFRIGYSQPIFDGKGLEQVLKGPGVFGDNITFGQLKKLTLITSYDTYNREVVVFKNTKQLHQSIPVWEICRASAAAPIAFPGHVMTNADFIADWSSNGYAIPKEKGIPLVDGGVFANDPALCAIAERLKWNNEQPENSVPIDQIVVTSFGTGKSINRIGIPEARGWGAAEWISPLRGIPLVDVFSDGASDSVGYISTQIMNNDLYFRFQPTLTTNISTFSANQENIEALQKTAEDYINKPETNNKLEQLINNLTSANDKPM
ncbi:patatin-like phospholipase family protein [Nostoc sp. FACHB-152]|uniref:patatin-like phospholipase family protein n=1 Tax=unclassified Nostoc TaxID=2593658 RepID=UPI00168401B0|nr:MULTISPECIES: patatin-like phospholipase family protein [unclassified Nostoc]MBD2445696.1 patatin-like phospholipase family protein [Nostoc sp. FACHB-152]MBD2466810.1 patatin-like phospholipase family protein [Nostoc sp. FACHB-145]